MPGFSSSSATAPARFSPGSIPNPKLGDAARSVLTDECQGRFLQILHRAQRRTADQCAVCGSDHFVNADSILARNSVVSGKRLSGSGEIVVRRIIKKKK